MTHPHAVLVCSITW